MNNVVKLKVSHVHSIRCMYTDEKGRTLDKSILPSRTFPHVLAADSDKESCCFSS